MGPLRLLRPEIELHSRIAIWVHESKRRKKLLIGSTNPLRASIVLGGSDEAFPKQKIIRVIFATSSKTTKQGIFLFEKQSENGSSLLFAPSEKQKCQDEIVARIPP